MLVLVSQVRSGLNPGRQGFGEEGREWRPHRDSQWAWPLPYVCAVAGYKALKQSWSLDWDQVRLEGCVWKHALGPWHECNHVAIVVLWMEDCKGWSLSCDCGHWDWVWVLRVDSLTNGFGGVGAAAIKTSFFRLGFSVCHQSEVCGVNGKTYQSPCAMADEGVEMACKRPCPCEQPQPQQRSRREVAYPEHLPHVEGEQ